MYMSKYSVYSIYIAYDISIYMEHTCIIDQTIRYRNWIPFIPATPRKMRLGTGMCSPTLELRQGFALVDACARRSLDKHALMGDDLSQIEGTQQ